MQDDKRRHDTAPFSAPAAFSGGAPIPPPPARGGGMSYGCYRPALTLYRPPAEGHSAQGLAQALARSLKIVLADVNAVEIIVGHVLCEGARAFARTHRAHSWRGAAQRLRVVTYAGCIQRRGYVRVLFKVLCDAKLRAVKYGHHCRFPHSLFLPDFCALHSDINQYYLDLMDC